MSIQLTCELFHDVDITGCVAPVVRRLVDDELGRILKQSVGGGENWVTILEFTWRY